MSTRSGVSAATCASGVSIKPVPENRRRRRLDVVGCHEFAAVHRRHRFADQEQVYGGPRAGPHLDLRRRPSCADQVAQIAQAPEGVV